MVIVATQPDRANCAVSVAVISSRAADLLSVWKFVGGGNRMKSKIATVIVCALLPAGAFAQAVAVSQITGTVHDASGSVVPQAQVTATQTNTGLVRNVVSGEDGTYLLPSLPVGPYR